MVVVAAAAATAAAVVFCANREVSSGFFPSFLWYPPVTRGRGNGEGERGGRERERAYNAAVAKRGKRDRSEGTRREKERSDRGSLLSAGLARRRRPCRAAARSVNVFSFFLALSLLFSLSLSPPPSPRSPSSRALSLASSRFPLSFIAPPTSSAPVLHRAHETRVPAKSLCHLANERPSVARIIPRRARSRKISSSRP